MAREEYRAHLSLAVIPGCDIQYHCEKLFSSLVIISQQWELYSFSLANLQPDLELDWWYFCKLAMVVDYRDSRNQQQLVQLLSNIRAFDSGSRSIRSQPRPVGTMETGPRENLWTALPFFEKTVQDVLRSSFEEHKTTPTTRNWQNLNAVLVRVCAAQTHVPLRICCIVTIRNILEENVNVTQPMMEVLVMWINVCGLWIEQLVQHSDVDIPYFDGVEKRSIAPALEDIAVEPGSLALQAGITSANMTIERWQFWNARLRTLLNANRAGEIENAIGSLAESALRGFGVFEAT